MNGSGQTVFAGLSAEELAALLGQLEHRRFAAGSCVLQEGDNPSAMYIIRSGTAEVLISDRFGASHRVDQAGPGEVLGEMSLLTGQPVSATVRALTDVDTLIIEGADFERVAGEFPLIFRNLGVVLANRLRRSNLRALRPHANTILLRDSGASTPALLAWTLACSMAWHVRRPVLLVVPSDARPEELEPLASLPAFDPARPPGSGASLLVARPGGELAPEALAATLDRLSHSYDYILFLSRDAEAAQPLPGLQARTVDLVGPHYIPEARAPFSAAAGRQPWHTLRAWANGGPAQRPGPDGALNVPPLQEADLGALRSGLLPAGTPASRALGWAARELCGLKVGLALGAGSEKGYAHIGVARVLQRASVPLDYIAGTSIGASVAAALADGYSLVELERIFTDVARAAFRLRLPGASLLSSAGMRDRLRAAAGGRRFEELQVPLAIVAADLVTGREIVFRRGVVLPALMASMAIPGIYPAQRMGKYVLVDGGIVNPVPGNVVASMGADRIIAVNLMGSRRLPPIEAAAGAPRGAPPPALQVLRRSIDIMQRNITAHTARASTVLIEPEFTSSSSWRGLRSASEGSRYIETGEAAAEAALPRLAAVLPWLNGS